MEAVMKTDHDMQGGGEADGLSAGAIKAREWLIARLPFPLNAPREAWEDQEFCLKAIGMNIKVLRCVPHQFWRDTEFCLRAVKITPGALGKASEKAVTPEMCLEAVRQDGEVLGDVPKQFLTEELMMTAVKQNGLALYYVPKWRLTKALICEAVTQNRYALQYVPEEWREEAKAAIAAAKKELK
jgi:hypothetical protein